MPEMKVVTPEQYVKALEKHQGEEYHLVIKGWQVPILHGLVALAADHPGIKAMGWPTHQVIGEVRSWCRQKFGMWGFSLEEVEYLDKMREKVQGGQD